MRSTGWSTSRRSARSGQKIRNVLKVGQEVTARVIKIDKSDRRIGLSIKAATYSSEQLKAEQAALDALKPGEDLVALQHAFDAADEAGAHGPELSDLGLSDPEGCEATSFGTFVYWLISRGVDSLPM